MPDQNDLLKAIRVIVKEEIQPVRDDVAEVKEDVRDLRVDVKEVKERLTAVENGAKDLKQKVKDIPEQLIDMIAEPFVKEDEYQDKRLTRLEKHNQLTPLPRPE